MGGPLSGRGCGLGQAGPFTPWAGRGPVGQRRRTPALLGLPAPGLEAKSPHQRTVKIAMIRTLCHRTRLWSQQARASHGPPEDSGWHGAPGSQPSEALAGGDASFLSRLAHAAGSSLSPSRPSQQGPWLQGHPPRLGSEATAGGPRAGVRMQVPL